MQEPREMTPEERSHHGAQWRRFSIAYQDDAGHVLRRQWVHTWGQAKLFADEFVTYLPGHAAAVFDHLDGRHVYDGEVVEALREAEGSEISEEQHREMVAEWAAEDRAHA